MAINVHIENVYVTAPGADLAPFLGDQVTSPVESSEALHDDVVVESAAPTEAGEPEIIDEEEAAYYESVAKRYNDDEAIRATSRSNFLRNLVFHVDRGRRLEGFQTNHQRRPRKLSAVSREQHAEEVMAGESLRNACGHCALKNNCRIADSLGGWLDIHPYKEDRTGKRRPGSGKVKATESRADFLKALRQDPLAHCDPTKRKPAAA